MVALRKKENIFGILVLRLTRKCGPFLLFGDGEGYTEVYTNSQQRFLIYSMGNTRIKIIEIMKRLLGRDCSWRSLMRIRYICIRTDYNYYICNNITYFM